MNAYAKKFGINGVGGGPPIAVTTHDFILLPGEAKMEPRDIDLSTWFTRSSKNPDQGIRLGLPIVGSPMDKVTREDMAVALANHSAIGVIDRNMTIPEMVEIVSAVKRTEPTGTSATLDSHGRLALGVAIGPFDLARAVAAKEAGADAIMVDVSHFDSVPVKNSVRSIILNIGEDIIAGNLGTGDAVDRVIHELDGRVSALRMGLGGGNVCTTTNITRTGSPALFATIQAADKVTELGLRIPVIADGGIEGPGDAALLIAAGADTIMLGNYLSATREAPGAIVWKLRNSNFVLGSTDLSGWRGVVGRMLDGKEDEQTKLLALLITANMVYRGMGSSEARTDNANSTISDRYAKTGGKQLAEGISTLKPYKGPVGPQLDKFEAGLRISMGLAGGVSVEEMKRIARPAEIKTPGYKLG